ncbi:MAG: phage head closure protein [Magnetococcales bacterium]|nr:phage head closure protein [Magnetococcales bacterium]
MSEAIAAGELNYRIIIQRKSSSKDTFGQNVQSWTTLDTVWANIATVNGREDNVGQLVSMVTSRITIRWNASYSDTRNVSGYRITCEGRIFNIQSVLPDRVGGKIVFLATEGASDG